MEVETRGRIYIAADRRNKAFIEAVASTARKNEYAVIFSPWDSGEAYYSTLVEKVIDKLKNSDLLIADLSMTQEANNWRSNDGVLAEYWMWMALGRAQALLAFAEESSPLDELHPFIHKEVRHYSLQRIPELETELHTLIVRFDNRAKQIVKKVGWNLWQQIGSLS